jgi:glycosyltransferase involved in cell wall biosynthesis
MSRKLKINIVLPFLNKNPGGGLKVMYQYANELAKNGHDVVIYHSMHTLKTHTERWFRKNKHIFFQKYLKLVRKRNPWWFHLDPAIKSFEIVQVDDLYIRDADIIFCTWWATAIEVESLSSAKGIKFNLIQDYEAIMTPHIELVHRSYQLKLHHIVISNYLTGIVESISNKKPPVIPNAIDAEQFFIETAIEDRNPVSISMLYADAERKGSIYGIEALKIVAAKYPALKVILFGVYKHPIHAFPDTFEYHYMPDNVRDIYNQTSIFISPSIHEGWGLPPMEAMACGCACVCTNIEGHLDFMIDGQTVLFVEPAKPEQMAEKIIDLIENNDLRLQLAKAANKHIQQFTWEKSCKRLETLFYNNLNG